MEKSVLKSEDYWKTFTSEQCVAMRLRCLVSGCQYGIKMIDKYPKDRCIWCGEKRPKGHFEGLSVSDLVSKLKE